MINKSQKLASSFGLALSKYLALLLLADPDVQCKRFGFSIILVKRGEKKKNHVLLCTLVPHHDHLSQHTGSFGFFLLRVNHFFLHFIFMIYPCLWCTFLHTKNTFPTVCLHSGVQCVVSQPNCSFANVTHMQFFHIPNLQCLYVVRWGQSPSTLSQPH